MTNTDEKTNSSKKIIMHSFGDPEPVLDGRSMFEYEFCPMYQNHYEYREKARRDIVEYIEIFYNRVRRHTKLGNISPAEAFQNFTLKAA